MPHKVGSELAEPAGAGSTPAELVVDSTLAAVESSESTPPAAGPSRDESAIGPHPWAWRKIWNEPTARMLGWRECASTSCSPCPSLPQRLSVLITFVSVLQSAGITPSLCERWTRATPRLAA